ncbi:MAG TPA: CAP domain-containing protein [Dehalococcoidia bacterium]|nr:CAP domain-containing protein [Dehalococcoidia bacterium]
MVKRLLLAALMLTAAVLVARSVSWQPTTASTVLDPEEQTFVSLINQYRQDNGLGPLSINIELENATRWMSQDLGVHNYFSHTDSLGRDPFQRMADFGYGFNTWKGESLAAGASSAQSAFDLWRGSPGHNANMLNPNYKVMGVARAYAAGSTYGWYWTNDFGGYDPTPAPTPTPEPGLDPKGDADSDGFTNGIEGHMGTDPLLACGGNGWPPDADGDRDADIGDAIGLFNGMLLQPANYRARSDFDADGDVDAGDVITGFSGRIFTSCGA